MKAFFHIAWIAIVELIHEKIFYLLALFGFFALGVSVCLGQMTYADQKKLTFDLLFGVFHLASILLSIFGSISLFQKEIMLGSISMILSKPVSRAHFLLGKFTGQAAAQLAIQTLMVGILVWVQAELGEKNFLPVLQAALLIFFESVVLMAMTYFFAVNGSPILTALSVFALFAVGHSKEIIEKNVEKSALQQPWTIISSFLPNLELFNTKALASYGVLLGAEAFGWSHLYFILCVAIFLLPACLCFHYKDLYT